MHLVPLPRVLALASRNRDCRTIQMAKRLIDDRCDRIDDDLIRLILALSRRMNCRADLGLLYMQGSGVAQNFAKAAQYFERGCNKDDGESCEQLGIMNIKGYGIGRNKARAIELFRKSARKGDRLSCSCKKAMKLPQDAEKAIVTLQRDDLHGPQPRYALIDSATQPGHLMCGQSHGQEVAVSTIFHLSFGSPSTTTAARSDFSADKRNAQRGGRRARCLLVRPATLF